MPANCSGIILGKGGDGGIRTSRIDNYDGADTPNIPATTGNTLNEVVEAIDTAIGGVTTPSSSGIDWDGALTISCLALTAPATVNTVIIDLITQICTNKTDIATNTAAIAALCDSDIEICTEITTTCTTPAITIASGTTLAAALEYMLQLICTNATNIGTGVVGVNEGAWDNFGSTSAGTDWIGAGGGIDISSGDLDPTIYNPAGGDSTYIVDGRVYNEVSTTVTVVATRDNYIKYDSVTEGYLVADVPLGDPAPPLPSGQVFLWIATTNATLVTATVDLRHVYNQDGTRWSDDSVITRHITDLNVTGDKLETYGTGTGTFDVGLGSIGVDDKGRVSSYSDSVNIAGLVNNQVLQYNSVASEWQNVDVSAVGGLPVGTIEGQMLRYNSTLTTWEATSTMLILGSSVSINSSPLPSEAIQLGSGSKIAFELPLVSVNSPSSLGAGTLPAATYFYVVTAIDVNGDETYISNEISLTIDGVTQKSIQVDWDILSGAASYRVYRGVATGAQTEYTAVPSSIFIDDDGSLVYSTAPPPTSNTALKVTLGNDGLGYNITPTSAKPFNFYDDWGDTETMINVYVGGGYIGTPTITGIKAEVNSSNPTGENIGLHVIGTNSGGGGFRALRVEDGIDNTGKYLKVIDADGNVDFTTAMDGNGIYDGSGSLSGATVVTMAANDLSFDSTTNTDLFYIDATNDVVGIGAPPFAWTKLYIESTDLSHSYTLDVKNHILGSITAQPAGIRVDVAFGTSPPDGIGIKVLASGGTTHTDGLHIICTTDGADNRALYGNCTAANSDDNIGAWLEAENSGAGKAYGLIVESGNIGVGTIAPDDSSILELVSTSQGFLPPRMTTTQKNAISTPAEALVIYDTTLNKLCVYTGAAWETITSS